MRSFTKSIADPVFAIATLAIGGVKDTRRHRRLGMRYPTSSLQRRRRGVTRARDPAAVRFTAALNLDADYYASRLMPRRNLDDVAFSDALRRDDGVTPEAIAKRGGYGNHEHQTAETFTCQGEQCDT